MDKFGDMDLFVRVVKNKGLAAAGREVGLSPARVTARINALEKRYGVRLLIRTTRRVSLTDTGREFYAGCERILAEVKQAEARLQTGRKSFTGPLRVTATSDLGQQYIAPILSKFVKAYPDVRPCLHLTDRVINIAEEGFDLAIRYGALADSTLIARKLANSRRVLCASPAYLRRNGVPATPSVLVGHDCLAMVRATEPLTTWHFQTDAGKQTVLIQPARATNDGALIRRWTLEGAGIALKSYWDIVNDLKAKRLVTVLDDYTQDFERQGTTGGADLHVVYPNRDFLPLRTRGFIEALLEYFSVTHSEFPSK